ncbi:iron-containing redox enzyme family protein [Nocardioides mesophilus]|uniref:Iron-containing redox enzyme family protein n=1 Tax=Nocardioides mesophilus TaxID=433659 RepID=A0A7G9R8I4_9ACTN|nr:iron-containing redox enzyme family protein [Nocardioides mesophilus]QNN51909.1 iron-containing redox enzyme family protein [Nocardioides mesophilus]
MRLPHARGPMSAAVVGALRDDLSADGLADLWRHAHPAADPRTDDDLHLALWVVYELHYRGFDGVDPAREWDPELLRARLMLEERFEEALRADAAPVVAQVLGELGDADPATQVERVIASVDGPDVSRFVQREATADQVLELMAQRSLYTLKESDPTSFVLPRLDGAAKAALAELQYDEYGGGRADRLHATLFARGLEACGLDPTYGAYLDQAPGHVLAGNNAMSLLCLNRRLRGAALGHLAAFEATSSLPCRKLASGIRRLELPDELWEYFDEHVEADAVHEQVALRSICGAAVDAEPALRADVLLGAAVYLQTEATTGTRTLDAWQQGRSCLVSAGEAVPA